MMMGLAVRAATLAAFAGLLLASPLQAQEGGATPTPTDDILDTSLSCVAAYDNEIANGDAEDDPAVLGARAAAFDLYTQMSGETSDEVAADIRKADADLHTLLVSDESVLDDYSSTCDAAFMDDTDEGSDDVTPLIA